jgi:hypothetical protein
LIDLAVSCHSKDGTHLTNSRVFLNDGHRFKNPRVIELPTTGPHFMQRADVGNIMDRRFRETYTSRALPWSGEKSRGKLTCDAKTPFRSRLEFSVRFADSKDGLESQPWIRTATAQEFTVAPSARVLQYKADFISSNGDSYPVLHRVSISLD